VLLTRRAALTLQGPDETPGFGLGRGKALEAAAQAAPGSAPWPPPAFAGLPLRGIIKSASVLFNLSVGSVQEFVPRSASQASLGAPPVEPEAGKPRS
jgi:hypothetical protein